MAFDPARVVRDYGDPQGEALACRTDCALFDFSFMARARLTGPGALAVIAQLTTRPLPDLEIGRIRYALRANARGDLLSDLTVWRVADATYEVMSGRREDIAFASSFQGPDCRVTDLTDETAIFSLQGPGSLSALAGVSDVGETAELPYFESCPAMIDGRPCLVGRLGYTGEAGFEIVCDRADAPRLWQLLSRRARQAGFAAADSLRIEAGFLLFANEFRLPVSAREAGLAGFAGAETPVRQRPIRLVCFRATSVENLDLWQPPTPSRPSQPGSITITSACRSVVAGGPLGLGFVLEAEASPGLELHDPRGAFCDVRLVPLPFFDADKSRPRAPWRDRTSGS